MVCIFFFFVLTNLKFVTFELTPLEKEDTMFSALGGVTLQILHKFLCQYANFGNKKTVKTSVQVEKEEYWTKNLPSGV